jgi:hypothetical protein
MPVQAPALVKSIPLSKVLTTEFSVPNLQSFYLIVHRFYRIVSKDLKLRQKYLTSHCHDVIELIRLAHAHIPLVKNYTYFRLIQSYPMRHLADLP